MLKEKKIPTKIHIFSYKLTNYSLKIYYIDIVIYHFNEIIYINIDLKKGNICVFQACTIQATIRNHYIEKFDTEINEWDFKCIHHFEVKTTSGGYRPADHEYQIYFESAMEMKPMTSPTFDFWFFPCHFKCIEAGSVTILI